MPMTANMVHKAHKGNRGFTIVELVIVIAIAAILIAVLVPTFSGAAENARQRALRMDLDNAYTSFRSDCGFRDEICMEMGAYIFLPDGALSYDLPAGGSVSNIKILGDAYTWDGNEDHKVNTLLPSELTPDFRTAVYGPFNGYYLIAYNQLRTWDGEGTSENPYLIRTYTDLRSIAEMVARGETFAGQHFRLMYNISITSAAWLPIGGYIAPTYPDPTGTLVFSGIFDGNGYTISLVCGRVDLPGYCLFGYTKNATIKNLGTNGTLDSTYNIGGVAGVAENTTITNCHNQATISADHHAGGIVGKAIGTTTIAGCMNEGKITAYEMSITGSDNAVGGIVGEADKNVSISDSCNNGNIYSISGTVGGIAGIARGKINNCVNNGAITAHSYAAQLLPGESWEAMSGTGAQHALAGGILGWGDGTAIINGCANTGAVNASFHSVGGIAGADSTILNCANIGDVTAAGSVGGMIGTISVSSCSVSNVMNSGTVTSTGAGISSNLIGPVGGIIGHVGLPGSFNLTLAVNHGTINFAKGKQTNYAAAGMLIGSAGGTVTLNHTYYGIDKAVYVGNNAVTGTAVGSSAGTTAKPTTLTNMGTLGSTMTNLVQNSYAGKGYLPWTMEEGYFGNYYVPVLTHVPTPVTHYKTLGKTLRLRLNTTFTGAANVYFPFLEQTEYISTEYASNGKPQKHTFTSWCIGLTDYQPGDKFTLDSDYHLGNAWSVTDYVMAPIPFG